MIGAAPAPAIPIAGLRPIVRDALGAAAAVAGPILIAWGAVLGGCVASAFAVALLAPRRLRAAPGWDAEAAGWVPVTGDELDRLGALLRERWRWSRDPWHVAGGAGILVTAGLAAAAAGLIGGVLLGIAPDLAERLALAALVALLPPLCVGGRTAATPAELASDLAAAQEVCAAARARPEPGWQPIAELLLASAERDRTVPAGARIRLALHPDPPALSRAWIERDERGAPHAVFRLHPEPAVRATVAALGPGFAVSGGTDLLQVTVQPGPDLLARVTRVCDRLQAS